LERYVNAKLNKYDYLCEPKWLSLENLIRYIEIKAMEWYKLFVVDTFSRIHWNLEKDARNNQNKCMEQLQDLVQKLWIAIVMLHHTNRSWTWEGSQKIMDLSNVFIVIERDYDGTWEPLTKYKLMKDKYTPNVELSLYYRNWKYEEF
jgi:RecA-family ATPase